MVMRVLAVVVGVAVWLAAAGRAAAEPFFEAVNLEPLRVITVQDNQTLKTLETFARQRLAMITGRTTLDGQRALPVVLDMTFRPELYQQRNIVRVKNVPLRKDFADFAGISAEEKERILKEGAVSLAFLERPDVQAFLEEVRGTAAFKNDAVNDLLNAGAALKQLATRGPQIPAPAIAPRAEGDQNWKTTDQIVVNVPRYVEAIRSHGQVNLPPPQPGYDGLEDLLGRIVDAQRELGIAWRTQNVAAANASIATLGALLPQVNPEVYPPEIKRKVEVWYNSAAKLTVPGAFVYFIAFALFILGVYSGVTGLRLWALRFFALAFVIHTVAIAVRWWLVSKSVGNWFESIPIKNQFESVLFSSWFGAAVGLGLELWRSRGVWGAAASFVGWLSLIAIFAAPFVAGREIGGEIGMAAGVLMSYWLYIHVTMAVAAYALIGMSFMLGVWWLIKYYGQYRTVSRLPKNVLAGDVNKIDDLVLPGPGGAALTMRQTLAAMLFVPVRRESMPAAQAAAAAREETLPADAKTRQFLATLDACNLVLLQMAFWVLGVAIILGAVWADQSWGRPWGWDPKETFALVTWIVYLAIIHIRMGTVHKAWWTAVLSIVGFAIMLFNWIGVNFFLVGLHSYA
ncbi:MAG: cytochrome c biogenesis protein [Tepidisphaerales bacterium]